MNSDANASKLLGQKKNPNIMYKTNWIQTKTIEEIVIINKKKLGKPLIDRYVVLMLLQHIDIKHGQTS